MRKFRKKRTIFAKKMLNFFFFGGGNTKILRKKYGREIIDYDMIKLLMLSSQTDNFTSFFAHLWLHIWLHLWFSRNFLFAKVFIRWKPYF